MRIVRRRRAQYWMAVSAGAAAVALVAAACSSGGSGGSSSSGSASVINGAGSTFAAPMYQEWAGQYHQKVNTSVSINYQSIGSGGGISEFTAGVVDFGASDAPMSSTERAAAQAAQGSLVLHIPMIIGAVAMGYNLPGVTGLKLDGPTIANIYLGKITKWNDPAIKKLNPGLNLPSMPITVVERADSSGTSYAFTAYLSAISPTWASQVGTSKAPSWPTGTGGTGNTGVAAAVQQTKGAIGYIEYGYTVTAHIPVASVVNASGQAVAPSTTSTLAAANATTYPTDITNLTFSLVNSHASGAYPISTPTYILIAQKQKNAAKGKNLVAWMKWCLEGPQQSEVTKLGYVPLPSKLITLDNSALNTVH